MLRLAILICTLLVVLAGCGYHPEGYSGVDQKPAPSLYLELARNKTGRAFIENALSNRVAERFGRSGRFHLSENRSQAELYLTIDITSFSSVAIAYDRTDTIRLYRSSLTLVGTLTRNVDGRILWKGPVSESIEYEANVDRAVQQANENEAIARLCELLADDLYARTIDDF